MKIRSSRICAALYSQGFVLHRTNGGVPSFGFARSDQIQGLYLQIVVSFAGRENEAVIAYVALSTLRWFQFRGLSERRLLKEIALNQERGWTEIANDAQAKDWEESLVRVAPAKLGEFATQMREGLRERTETVRQRARLYLDRLDPKQPMTTQIQNLERTVSSDTFAEADRLAHATGVMQLRGTADVYMLSCLAILSAADGAAFFGQDPLMNIDLMWQIQLVADGILSWDVNAGFLKI